MDVPAATIARRPDPRSSRRLPGTGGDCAGSAAGLEAAARAPRERRFAASARCRNAAICAARTARGFNAHAGRRQALQPAASNVQVSFQVSRSRRSRDVFTDKQPGKRSFSFRVRR